MRGTLVILLALAPFAALANDATEGRRLAEQWCAACHRISPTGPGPASDAVPAFATIATRPGRNEAGIATFLRVPHSGMPDLGITLQQSRDLAAYVMSQRPQR